MMRTEPHFIGGAWRASDGAVFSSLDPATGEVTWAGRAATAAEVAAAVDAARAAQEAWSSLAFEARAEVLRQYVVAARERREALADAIGRETGKPTWEALREADAVAAKVAISIEAQAERRRETSVALGGGGGRASTRYKPHGAMAVFGPFNMPAHLPNGHILPALLAGNTVVFKPSEQAPLVAEVMATFWQEAGLPAGVFNVVQGGRETGAALAAHPGIDGILFTGSVAAGQALARASLDHPGRIVALEMGGNNPLIVHDVKDADAAATLTIRSAYLTAGQRCTCARRLIVPRGAGNDAFVERLAALVPQVRVGPRSDRPEPFMGPVISPAAADGVLARYEALVRAGGVPLVPMRRWGTAFLSPALVDVTGVADRPDEEVFGPLLQLVRVADFDAAIAEANATRFGLSAGLLSDDRALFEPFYRRVRAGVVSINRQTTDASSQLPFGGIGLSGNHRPAGAFAADYCSYPVAVIERERPEVLATTPAAEGRRG